MDEHELWSFNQSILDTAEIKTKRQVLFLIFESDHSKPTNISIYSRQENQRIRSLVVTATITPSLLSPLFSILRRVLSPRDPSPAIRYPVLLSILIYFPFPFFSLYFLSFLIFYFLSLFALLSSLFSPLSISLSFPLFPYLFFPPYFPLFFPISFFPLYLPVACRRP